MNYTDKFHFPQWDETDPILRKDFNGAMDSAETGLVRAEDSFFRMAYNRFHYMRSLEAAPRQIGYFQQSFEQGGGSSFSGLIQMDGRLWMGNGAEDVALDQFRDTIVTSGNMVGFHITFTFVPSHCGWITGIWLSGSFTTADYTIQFPGTVSVYNQTADRREWTGSAVLNIPKSGMNTGPFEISGVRFPVIGGHGYTINFYIPNGKGTPNLSLDPKSNCLTVEKLHMVSASAEALLQEEEDSQGGIVLVRTQLWGEGAKLTLDWDGEIIEHSTIRQITENRKNYDEIEFRRWTPVPAESKLRLNIACSPGGAVDLYEWGAMLI